MPKTEAMSLDAFHGPAEQGVSLDSFHAGEDALDASARAQQGWEGAGRAVASATGKVADMVAGLPADIAGLYANVSGRFEEQEALDSGRKKLPTPKGQLSPSDDMYVPPESPALQRRRAISAAGTKAEQEANLPEWFKAPITSLINAFNLGTGVESQDLVSKHIDSFADKLEKQTNGGLLADDIKQSLRVGMNTAGVAGIRAVAGRLYGKYRVGEAGGKGPNGAPSDSFSTVTPQGTPLEDFAARGPAPKQLERPVIEGEATRVADEVPQLTQRGAADPKLLAAIAAGGGIAAWAIANPEAAKDAAVGGMLMGGAIKPKGGMWHPEAVERLAEPLKTLQDDAPQRNSWADSAVSRYLNKHAGTETDPLRDVEIPFGEGTKRWEEVTDGAIVGRALVKHEAEPIGAKTGETVYNVARDGWRASSRDLAAADSTQALTSYLSHVGDYLREHVPPDKLPQYDLVRAVKETSAWDKELAKKMDRERADDTKSATLYKDYGDGVRWVQLDKPGQFARESDAMGHSVRGYEPPNKGRVFDDNAGGIGKTSQAHPDWIPASGDSGHPSYGLGGWEAIKRGDAKVYSLRDAKGKSLATVEVDARNEVFNRPIPRDVTEVPQRITQIKGPQNRAPSAAALPYVQDFVRSGKWGEVGDLHNTGLFKDENGNYVAKANPNGLYSGDRGQRGSIDPKLLATLGMVAGGAALGAYLDPDHPIASGLLGAGAGILLRRIAAPLWDGIKSPAKTISYSQGLADKLYQLNKMAQANQLSLFKFIKDIPKEYKQHAEAIYHSMEDPSVKLSPAAQALKTKYVEPLMAMNSALRAALKAKGVDVGGDVDAYVHRIAQGHSSIFEDIAQNSPQGKTFSQFASALKERTVFALEDPASGEKVYAVMDPTGTGFKAYKDGKVVGQGNATPAERASGQVKFGNTTWKKGPATTAELETHTPIRYYHDALASAIGSNARLAQIYNNVRFLEDLRSDPAFGKIATKDAAQAPADWREVPDIPQLRGLHFEPRVANVLEDWAGPGGSGLAENIGKISRFLTGSLFWNPLPHEFNVLDHSIVQRGLVSGWLNPMKYPGLIETSIRAAKAVVTQNTDYIRYLNEGAGLMYANVLTHDFNAKVLKKLGAVPEMKGIAKAWGYVNPVEMVKRIYAFSRHNLWAVNDIIMMQAYLEKSSVPRADVIRDVERHIPNYRIPDQVAGSRTISQFMQSPIALAFGRYDYGRIRSYGTMLKDMIARDSTIKDRAKALDQMAMVAVMGLVVYPLIMDKIAKAITGNENASWQRFGAATVPHLFYEWAKGDKTLAQALSSMFPLGAALKSGMELATNRDLFTGGHLIAQPADVTAYAAKQLSPLGTASRVQEGKTTPGQVLLQSFGIKSPTDEQVLRTEKFRDREERTRQNRIMKEKGMTTEEIRNYNKAQKLLRGSADEFNSTEDTVVKRLKGIIAKDDFRMDERSSLIDEAYRRLGRRGIRDFQIEEEQSEIRKAMPQKRRSYAT